MSEQAPPIDTRIFVGIDGSDESKNALRWADYLARMSGCTITAVAVWTPVPAFAWAGLGSAVIPADLPKQAAKEDLEATLDEVLGAERSALSEALVRKGNPAHVLIDVSAGARMLVVGSRGVGGFTGLLLGSVSTACAAHAKCPVLIVHADNPPE